MIMHILIYIYVCESVVICRHIFVCVLWLRGARRFLGRVVIYRTVHRSNLVCFASCGGMWEEAGVDLCVGWVCCDGRRGGGPVHVQIDADLSATTVSQRFTAHALIVSWDACMLDKFRAL